MYVELAHQAGAIGIDGLGAQIQARGDLLGAGAFHQEREYLILAGTQSLQRVVGNGLLPGAENLVQFKRRRSRLRTCSG